MEYQKMTGVLIKLENIVWDIWKNKEDKEDEYVNNFKNSFAYDWDMVEGIIKSKI